MRYRFLPAALWLLTCAPTAAALPAGPGPVNYTVQPQPASCHYRGPLPDPICTPGAINPMVTQDNLQATVCKMGYTKSIRPPKDVTEAEKRASMVAYGYAGKIWGAEYDHLVPLELGGDPNDPRNLWLEPGASPNPKDDVELRLHDLVCAGKMSLAAAQNAIASDWTTA